MIVIAVDPGLTGACSLTDQNGLRAVFDLPVMKIPGVGETTMVQNKIDGAALRKLVLQHCPADEPVTAVMESVGAMGPGSAVQTTTSLVRSLGAIEAVLECLGVRINYVAPVKWKRFFGLIDPNLKPNQRKAKAMECARRLYPTCESIGLAKHHNRAEAILIGHWYRRHNA